MRQMGHYIRAGESERKRINVQPDKPAGVKGGGQPEQRKEDLLAEGERWSLMHQKAILRIL